MALGKELGREKLGMLRRRFASSSCFFDCSLRLRLATMEVDSEIARVQSQIDKVEKDIELVESECRTALTSEDKQYLREKEKALREKEKALRAEKNALREKENKLLEKENKLLEKENKLLDLQLKNGLQVGLSGSAVAEFQKMGAVSCYVQHMSATKPEEFLPGRAKKRYKPGTEFKDFAANAVGLNRTPDMKFWEVAADPLHNFKGPFLIWNRKSYDHLTEIIEGHLNNSTYERFIILGTAGIGKSLFTLLWVMKLAAKECRVVYKYGSMHHILDFTNKTKPEVTGPFDEGSLELQESLDDTSTWLVIDGKQEGGLRYRCKMLVACSTKPGNYEEFGKNLLACKLYLPAWSMEEVESFMNDFEAHRASYPEMKVMTDKEAVLKHFEVIGGIPRYVLMHGKFEEGKHRVDAAVNAVSTNSERLFSLLSGVYDQSLSDCIVHIFVKDDCCTRWYEFASGYVQDALAESFEKASRLDVVSFLAKHYSNSELATFWGKLYEERVHQMLLAGGAFKIKRVYEGGGEDPEEQLDIPPQHFVRFNGIQQLQVHPAGTYLRPTSRTFQSIDGILCPNKLIQAFKRVNNNHRFKAHGLEVVDNQLKQSEYELYSCVPPEQFETTKFRNYLNKEGNVFHGTRRATMNVLDKCVQFVLEVGYRELHI